MMKEIHSFHSISASFPPFQSHHFAIFLQLSGSPHSTALAGCLCTLLELGAKGPSFGAIPSRAAFFELFEHARYQCKRLHCQHRQYRQHRLTWCRYLTS